MRNQYYLNSLDYIAVMGFLQQFEGFFGWLLLNFKHHEDKMITKNDMFADIPNSIEVKCTDAAEPNRLDKKHEYLRDNQFPIISWKIEPSLEMDIKSFAVIVQDIDIPFPFAALHGCFFNITEEKRAFNQEDIDAICEQKSSVKYIKNILGSIYIGPRPLLNHGDHRYVYQVIGLKKTLDLPDVVSFKELETSLRHNIVLYGTWTGAYRRDY